MDQLLDSALAYVSYTTKFVWITRMFFSLEHQRVSGDLIRVFNLVNHLSNVPVESLLKLSPVFNRMALMDVLQVTSSN